MADVLTPQRTPRPIREIDPARLNLPNHMSHMRAAQLTLQTDSPVNMQTGSFEFDRIIKQGELLKRNKKLKSWKPITLLLRPNVLSIYSDKDATKLRHRIILSDLTAVARQKDPKRRDKHVFGLFSPSRNFHLEASSDQDAQDWVEVIRREARMDEKEEELMLMSPGGAHTSPWQGFERSIDAQVGAGQDERPAHAAGYASSSDADAQLNAGVALPKVRTRDSTNTSTYPVARQPSYAEYSGAERTSMSDFSDTAGPAARLSALSLAQTDPRPSTSSTQPVPPPITNAIYGSSAPGRPTLGPRNPSQLSTNLVHTNTTDPSAEERIIHHSHLYLLKSHRGVRSWKKVWVVVRPKGMSLYKNSDEYAALLVLNIGAIIDAVEMDPISKTKNYCFMIITEERNHRFCAMDEAGLIAVLGALKSLVSRRRARLKEREGQGAGG